MLPEKEWFIEAPWGRICIVAWGDCFDSPVLLCHGSVDSAVSFRPLVNLLPTNFYYIGLELPGNGKSDPFPPGLMISVYDYTYVIEIVAKHFRWEQFSLIAHSMGAGVGKMYNVCFPGKLSKLVELDPINFFAITSEEFGAWYEYFFTNFYNNYEKFNRSKEKAVVHNWSESIELLTQKRGLSEETAAATLERWSEPVGKDKIRYTFDPRTKFVNGPAFSPQHVRDIFTNIKTPTLIFFCTESYNKGYFRNTQFLLDEGSYPSGNVRVREVDGPHDVHITAPEKLSPYIEGFLLNGIKGVDVKSKL